MPDAQNGGTQDQPHQPLPDRTFAPPMEPHAQPQPQAQTNPNNGQAAEQRPEAEEAHQTTDGGHGNNQPAHEPEQTQPEQADPNFIYVIVRDRGDSELYFRIKPTTVMKRVMDAFCKRTGSSRLSKRFLFDGDVIHDNDTAAGVSVHR